MDQKCSIRLLTASERDIPISWAEKEGWNPGLHDADCHYAVDPDGWFCAESDGEIVGTAVVTNYDNRFSFGGFYIIREGFRDKGIGWALSRAAIAHCGGRNLGIDGVYAMQDKYAEKDGMIFAYRNIRWEGTAAGREQKDLIPAREIPFEALNVFDARHFPAERRSFLSAWVSQPDSYGLCSVDRDEQIIGYGLIRRCFTGYKVGPLFADTPAAADQILTGLCSWIPGEPFYFDTPEPNQAAVRMAEERRMTEVFGTARMYSREIPNLPLEQIFGVTSFELG